jgi:crotonobetainyl-CoA:carnitine CoA-transferase CaiB-like acyl-CoA transferase
MSGPLTGTRGIVLTHAWAGSYCTQLLGLQGADIIQVEVRKRPDSWRGDYKAPLPKALVEVATAEHPWNCNFLYNSVNLNKRCITLDLQDPAGVAVFKQLLPFADFVVENFSPRVLGNLGLDYEAMKAIKPDVILCSLAAYGHSGPWGNVPGIGGTIEPTSGMSGLLGYRDGPPINSGQMYPDAVAGLNGFAAILTALHHRDRTGEGQYIDVSMQEANLTFLGDAALEYTTTGHVRARQGNRHLTWAPHGIFQCTGEERWIALACESEAQWRALCAAAALGWELDWRWATNALRKEHEDALEAVVGGWTATQDRDALAARLSEAGVLAAAVLDGHEVANDPTLRARGVVREIDHAETGRWPQAVNPLHFSRTPATDVRPAPLLGEHTAEVLAELLGTSGDEYEALVAAGVSGIGPPD